MITIENLLKERGNNLFMGFSGVEGPTPIEIVNAQISEITTDWSNMFSRYLFPASGYLTYSVVVYWKLFESLRLVIKDDEDRRRHILENMLYLSEINPYLCHYALKQGFINVIEGDYLEYETKMKFDAILGNPPYHKNTNNVGAGHTLWDKFVEKSFELCKESGYVSLVHPSGWRNISGSFEKVKEIIKSKDLIYLEMHNIQDGIKMFGASTRYDVYVAQNCKNNDLKTIIIDEVGNNTKINVTDLDFIPNKNIDILKKITANDGDDKIELCFSHSTYDPRKPWMSKEVSEINILPCVKYISKVDNSIDFRFSSENRGMFGKPKVMFGIGSQVGGIIPDYDGKYGLCQFVAGIVDEKDNLDLIVRALTSNRFIDLMKSCQFTTQQYNYKIISTFRKDFWREFIDD
jgi:hypothetical protein